MSKFVHKGIGFGVNTPLSLICYKHFIICANEINCFRTHCLLICRLTANIAEWICIQVSRNIVNGPKRNNWVSGLSSAQVEIWVVICIQETLFADLPSITHGLCSAIAHSILNNCLYFVCYGWSAHALTALATCSGVASPKTLGGKTCLILGEKHNFAWKNTSQSTKWL